MFFFRMYHLFDLGLTFDVTETLKITAMGNYVRPLSCLGDILVTICMFVVPQFLRFCLVHLPNK